MKLTLYTDYSLRVLIFLAARPRDELSNIKEIAEAYHISKNHLMKVTHELGKLGLIETIRGRNGGIRLALQPEEINIGKVVRQTEDDFHLVECFNPDTNRCAITSVCGLKHVLFQALQAYLAVLDRYTLKDLAANPEALSALLLKNSEE
ncbi:RrF2 family transcriptional regulator [Pseudobacillus badius]|uniref:RrF2 family transcriptional regulator n=1 Tax=Bacillus badius TaxID=1455 RepID=UPI0007B0585D|nr:Rrf2 family transcriptional regulator [Bacillus badius]KZN98102.1 Rrf2 family transcriptional regulator [Bacillus badius]MED0665363.1 Rrf2 family transcriptional regulator [Bacillus badius]OCS82366.1 Rrf2 family transcriptional regulator [Bacillus badius]OVE50989.1 Rrf2 family transcriptional regulator [Bacillus badius]TDW01799.1 BadM/Rrf2 family transcriptional regulator [Bacillus badius]